jgi:hypothetical protein
MESLKAWICELYGISACTPSVVSEKLGFDFSDMSEEDLVYLLVFELLEMRDRKEFTNLCRKKKMFLHVMGKKYEGALQRLHIDFDIEEIWRLCGHR